MAGFFGTIAFFAALGAAVYLLIRTVKRSKNDAPGEPSSTQTDGAPTSLVQRLSNETAIKGIIWLLFCAALFAAKLWPLALMVLVAAGAVLGIEGWKQTRIDGMEAEQGGDADPPRAPVTTGASITTREDAAKLLGLSPDSPVEEVKKAHRNLISRLHPDTGGTDFLATQINQARDLLLRDEKK
ncbi:MAG: hypothetical protein AAFQ29_01645 [Pseudomonadota bacterium]